MLQVDLRAELEHEAGVDIRHNQTLDSISVGPFQILGKAEQDCSPALLHLVTLRFWKVMQRVKLSHDFIRDAPHPDEALLLVKPRNQGGLITMPGLPWGLQVCRGCHVHSPGRTPLGGVPPIG